MTVILLEMEKPFVNHLSEEPVKCEWLAILFTSVYISLFKVLQNDLNMFMLIR